MDPIKDMIKQKRKESKRTKEERLTEQLQLVAGFSDDGIEMITLEQLIQMKIALLAEISKEQQNKLRLKELKHKKNLKLHFWRTVSQENWIKMKRLNILIEAQI